MQKKGGGGFPYCTIMNSAGDVIWEVRPTSEEAIAKGFASARKLIKLQAAAKQKPDDATLEASAAMFECLGRSQRKAPPDSETEAWAKVEGVDKDVLKSFTVWSTEKKIAGAMRKRGACYEMLKGGTAPEAGSRIALSFFMSATREAIAEEDGDIAAKAFKGLEPEWNAYLKKNPKFKDNPRSKRTFDMIDGFKKKVAELQKGADK